MIYKAYLIIVNSKTNFFTKKDLFFWCKRRLTAFVVHFFEKQAMCLPHPCLEAGGSR